MHRNRLPRQRTSHTQAFRIGDTEGYLITGYYESGQVGEMFLNVSKSGSTMHGLLDAFSIAISLGLQYGVPLEAYVEKFKDMRFEPSGDTNDPEISQAASIVDYVFRKLGTSEAPPPPKPKQLVVEHHHDADERTYVTDAPFCQNCGNRMQRAGSCHVCDSCGTTSGCS